MASSMVALDVFRGESSHLQRRRKLGEVFTEVRNYDVLADGALVSRGPMRGRPVEFAHTSGQLIRHLIGSSTSGAHDAHTVGIPSSASFRAMLLTPGSVQANVTIPPHVDPANVNCCVMRTSDTNGQNAVNYVAISGTGDAGQHTTIINTSTYAITQQITSSNPTVGVAVLLPSNRLLRVENNGRVSFSDQRSLTFQAANWLQLGTDAEPVSGTVGFANAVFVLRGTKGYRIYGETTDPTTAITRLLHTSFELPVAAVRGGVTTTPLGVAFLGVDGHLYLTTGGVPEKLTRDDQRLDISTIERLCCIGLQIAYGRQIYDLSSKQRTHRWYNAIGPLASGIGPVCTHTPGATPAEATAMSLGVAMAISQNSTIMAVERPFDGSVPEDLVQGFTSIIPYRLTTGPLEIGNQGAPFTIRRIVITAAATNSLSSGFIELWPDGTDSAVQVLTLSARKAMGAADTPNGLTVCERVSEKALQVRAPVLRIHDLRQIERIELHVDGLSDTDMRERKP